jgi:hypothetical protein
MSLAQVASSHGTHHQGSGLRQIWERIFTQYSTDMWELEPVIRRSERSATQSNRPGPPGAAAMAIGRPAGLGVMVPVPRNEPFAMRQMTVGNVRHGSLAATQAIRKRGCFSPESGLEIVAIACRLWAKTRHCPLLQLIISASACRIADLSKAIRFGARIPKSGLHQ